MPVFGRRQINWVTCPELAEGAAQTTLMVVEFQKWYREQNAALGQTGQ